MKELAVLIGDWDVEVEMGGVVSGGAVATFSWLLDGAFLLQTTSVDHPDAPDSYAVVTPTPEGFLQHYFDSRGVVRLYEMRFDGTTWTLTRTAADFSALDFGQRFIGTLSPDGRTVDGRWESAQTPGAWELDFPITYRRR